MKKMKKTTKRSGNMFKLTLLNKYSKFNYEEVITDVTDVFVFDEEIVLFLYRPKVFTWSDGKEVPWTEMAAYKKNMFEIIKIEGVK